MCKFVDYFIEEEKEFLTNINTNLFSDKYFKFYMEWFIYAIDKYAKKPYDLNKRFIYFFNNMNLDIRYFVYIYNTEFQSKVIERIVEYKKIYKKENIY